MKRIFKTSKFGRWQRKADLADKALLNAVDEMENGLFEADLGGGVLKKRVALPGRGKRGGSRTLVATNRGNRWFFVHVFAKNEKDNITKKELEGLHALATDYLSRTSKELDHLVRVRKLEELLHENENDKT